ncbi:hypothetical protein SARC_10410 [Sphaeroforma arctica JP610]|uniref:Uncharacterized protein n=1 Tax=Sphaeroforma arctica JP610 TaxID=667725 RepID=A0A0L0FK23_9EUKA|nr:hypothetical protein SARC_10410 [Sphaeroforma arctica JP610]KNC77119.1 hypothetical protein SARC_10410 [Sphaeroforma arctica JP610]|eukprot:XP_014151021.1 hypothetical protein SARC_10410 [Sphaeroforma arctica JP610]
MTESQTTIVDGPKSPKTFFRKKRRSITQALLPRMKPRKEAEHDVLKDNGCSYIGLTKSLARPQGNSSEVLYGSSPDAPLLSSRSMQSIQRDILNWAKNDQSVATLLSQNNYGECASNWSRLPGILLSGLHRGGSTESGNSILESRATAFANELANSKVHMGEGEAPALRMRGSRGNSLHISNQQGLKNSTVPSQNHIDMLRANDSLTTALAQETTAHDVFGKKQFRTTTPQKFENISITQERIASLQIDHFEAELLAMSLECSEDDFRKNENWYSFGTSREFTHDMDIHCPRRQSAPSTTVSNVRDSSDSFESTQRLAISYEVVRAKPRGHVSFNNTESSAPRYSELPCLTPSQKKHQIDFPKVYLGSAKHVQTYVSDRPVRTNTIFKFEDASKRCSKSDCTQAKSAAIPCNTNYDIVQEGRIPDVRTSFSTIEEHLTRVNYQPNPSSARRYHEHALDSNTASEEECSMLSQESIHGSLHYNDDNHSDSAAVSIPEDDKLPAVPLLVRSHTIASQRPGSVRPIPKPRPRSAFIATQSANPSTKTDGLPSPAPVALKSSSLPSIAKESTYVQSVLRDGSELHIVPVNVPLAHSFNGNVVSNIVGLVIAIDPTSYSAPIDLDRQLNAQKVEYRRRFQEAFDNAQFAAQHEPSPIVPMSETCAATTLDMNFVGKSSVEVFRNRIDATHLKKQNLRFLSEGPRDLIHADITPSVIQKHRHMRVPGKAR